MKRPPNGVRIFSATTPQNRAAMGDAITTWIARNPTFEIVDMVVTQSSDRGFHCVAITIFYWEPLKERGQ